MNRICAAFDDIGNIDMNWAEVPPFNWQMLMTGPCFYNRSDIVSKFCDLDKIKVSLAIRNAEESPANKDLIDHTAIIYEYISEILTEKFGSLEICYPYIVKHLFTGENIGSQSHKQTFWRVFGKIAVQTLRNNLENCHECRLCGALVPNWAKNHACPKDSQGFYNCIDCDKLCKRTNSRQQRCPECQKDHRLEMRRIVYGQSKEMKRKEREKFTSYLNRKGED